MKKKKNSITFHEYYEKYRTPFTVFAANCGVSFHQIYHIYRGGVPTLKTAVAIQNFTEGEVTCEKLLPVKKVEDVKNDKKS